MKGGYIKKGKCKETDIKNAILEFLNYHHVFCWPNDSVGIFDPVKKIYRKKHSRFAMNGVSDILGVLPDGRFLAIEVKSDKGRCSDDQVHFLGEVNKRGGLAFVAKSVDDVKFWMFPSPKAKGTTLDAKFPKEPEAEIHGLD